MKFGLRARLISEFVGTAFLVSAVVGSGIMGERFAGGNVAIALLANTIATGAALVALILTFGPISGAHLNPAVTLADAIERGIAWPDALAYMAVQCAGGIAGAIIAHLMFGLRWYSLSSHPRHGWAQVFSEFVATFGLLSVIWGCSRLRSGAVPFAVASYITAAYWFTASTSFANPAGQVLVGFFRGDSTCQRSSIHRGATGGSLSRDLPISVAHSEPARSCRRSLGLSLDRHSRREGRPVRIKVNDGSRLSCRCAAVSRTASPSMEA
jgi:glycerol uptake facilitator-like aquaporin